MNDEARAFLELFDGRHTFQTFDDKKKRADLAQIHHDATDLERLNKLGAGVYLMVNEGDGKGRNTKSVTRVRAVFADFDGQPLPDTWPVPPSALVESSAGRYHAYWLVVDFPLERETFNHYQEHVAHAVGSSPSDAKGLARVMRVPGFLHHKHEPFRTRLLEAHPDRVYTISEITAAFDIPDRPEKQAATAAEYKATTELTEDGLPTAEKILEVMLARADLNKGRNNIGFHIACQLRDNRHPISTARWVLSEYARLVGANGEHPYTVDEALASVRQAYSQQARAPWAPLRRNAGIITFVPPTAPDDADAPSGAASDPVAAPEPPPPPGVYVQHGCYYIDVKKGDDWNPVRLTNWTWQPYLKLQYPDGSQGERGTLIVNNTRAYALDLPSNAWNSRRELLDTIGKHDAVCFTTNNKDIANIRQAIILTHNDLPTARGVRTYGLHQHGSEWVGLYENETITTQDTPPIFYASTPVDPASPAHAAPPKATNQQIEDARDGIRAFMTLITPTAALTMLGYAVASPFAPRITPHLGNRLPFLYIAGEREAGKTSAAQIILELATGNDHARLHKAPSMTPYQYDLAYSNANNLLALLDEYKPGALDDSQLRKHHDLGTKWRGSGIAAKDHAYNLNSPLIVLGEGFTDDAATLSRGVLVFIEKKDRGAPQAYNDVRTKPLWAYARHLIQLARQLDQTTHLQRIGAAEELVTTAKSATTINPRLEYALTYVAYGLLTLQLDLAVGDIAEDQIIKCLKAGIENTLDGGEESMTSLELFLERLGTAAVEHRNAYSLIVPGANQDEIIIRISPAVDAVQKRFGAAAPITNNRLLRKYAGQVTWCDQGESHKDHRGGSIRGIRVKLSEVPSRCDVSALEYLNVFYRSPS